MADPDRLALLRAQSVVTGVDFVLVHPGQTTIDVYFFHEDPGSLTPSLVGAVGPGDVTIRSTTAKQSPSEVGVLATSWSFVGTRRVLRLDVEAPGGFSDYSLRIAHAQLDPYFNGRPFSFKAACERDVDCAPVDPGCIPEHGVDVPIDYLARDFWSFRRALLEFAAIRYPAYQERLEADVGVMLAEVMSALGDELSYAQDRVAREAYLETATERRSITRHARLVDYFVDEGAGARAWLDLTIVAGGSGAIAAGEPARATYGDGRVVAFEIGRGLGDTQSGTTYAVDSARNSLEPHLWSREDSCLAAFSTEVFVEGHQAANLPLDDVTPGQRPGRWVLLATRPTNPATPERRQMVRLVAVEETSDPLVVHPVHGSAVTRLVWSAEDAPPFDMTLVERDPTTGISSIVFEVRGNVVPVTAGRTVTERFVIGPTFDLQTGPEPDEPPSAVERAGRDGSITYLHSLAPTESAGLVFLDERDGGTPESAGAEIALFELRPLGGGWVRDRQWRLRRSLVGSPASGPDDFHFSLDYGQWRRVVGYHRNGEEVVHRDYAAGGGFTVRFGDGTFGALPVDGTVFEVVYRVGGGTASNVESDSIREFASASGLVEAVTNPLPASGGRNREPDQDVRERAPEAFRHRALRAVRPSDYAEAAERLPWVQRAGARTRWTGSWLTTFVTPDPEDANELSAERRRELGTALDRVRQAGREVCVSNPRYADLDIGVHVCLEQGHFAGDVGPRILEALFGARRRRGGRQHGERLPFFHPDRFTFGTPLDRTALEAAIQRVPGVLAVRGMRLRQRGRFAFRPFREALHVVARNEVVRVENDPLAPDRGTITLDFTEAP